MFHDLLADLRYGLRMFARSPGFTAIAAGCSATGWAVREVPDGSDLRPGEKVVVDPSPDLKTGALIKAAAK